MKISKLARLAKNSGQALLPYRLDGARLAEDLSRLAMLISAAEK